MKGDKFMINFGGHNHSYGYPSGDPNDSSNLNFGHDSSDLDKSIDISNTNTTLLYNGLSKYYSILRSK